MAIKQKNVFGNEASLGYRLPGVATTESNYKLLENRSSVNEGDIWYDTTNNVLKTYDGTNWSAAGLNSQSAGSLNDAASVGGTITVDGSTVSADFAVTVSSGGNDVCATLTQNDTTTNPKGLVLVNTGTGVTLDFTSSGTYDIQGTSDLWDITAAGAAHFTAVAVDDDEDIELGTATSGDVKILFHDANVGTTGAGLVFKALAADEQIYIGDNSYAFDIFVVGASNANYMYWDLDGGRDSLGLLKFDNTDILLGDNDSIMLGDGTTSGDILIRWDGTNLDILPDANNTDIIVGTTSVSASLKIHGDTYTSYMKWDDQYDRLFFESAAAAVDTMMQFDDWATLTFGTGTGFGSSGDGDWQLYCSGATNNPLTLIPTTDNSIVVVGNSGATKNADLQWYTGGVAGAGLFIDASADKVYLDKADFHLGDDDYIVFGDSGVAGTSADATIRWDNTNAVLEIFGATKFDAGNVTMDDNCTVTGNLAVGGTLTLTGAFNTGDISMADSEHLYFGGSNDIDMYWNGTTNALVIEGATQGTSIEIGYTNSQDVNIYGDTATNFMKYDGTANTFTVEGTDILMQDDDIIRFGDSGEFSIYYDEASTDNLILTSSTANDAVQIGNGSTGTDLKIMNTVNSSAYILWDDSGETWYFGQDTHGVDVWFKGDNGYDACWDESADTLYFEDNAALGIGASSGTPDLELISNGTTVAGIMSAPFVLYGDGHNIYLGTSGTHGSDLYIKSATADNYIKWDAGTEVWTFGTTGGAGTDVVFQSTVTATNKITYDAGAGELQFGDDAILGIGGATNATADLKIYTAGTTTIMAMASDLFIYGEQKDIHLGTSGTHGSDVYFHSNTADNYVQWDSGLEAWKFGTTGGAGTDVVFQSAVTASNKVTYDSGAGEFQFGDDAILSIGGATNATADIKIYTAGATGTIELASDLIIYGDAKTVRFGNTGANGTDVIFDAITNANYVKWDAGAETWTFGATAANGVDVVFQGTNTAQNQVKWDAGTTKWTFGATTQNGVDVVFDGTSVASALVWDAGNQMLHVNDNAYLGIGTSSATADLKLTSNGTTAAMIMNTDLIIYGDAKTVRFGNTGANGTDVIFDAITNANYVKWDAGAESWTFGATAANGVDVIFQGVTTNANTVKFDAGAESWTFGSTRSNSIDVTFESSYTSASVAWDAGAATWTHEAGTRTIVKGDTTAATLKDTLFIPIVTAAPTAQTSAPGGTCAICYHDSSAAGTSGDLYVQITGSTIWNKVGVS